MLASLSHRNMKRQLSEYKIFWFSLIGVVALMYAFNSLIVSRTMQQLFRLFAESGNGDIGVIATLFSAVVVFALGWFISYMMDFILQRRSREISTYMILGVEKSDICKMIFRENAFFGLVAIILGFGFGILVSKILESFVSNLFHFQETLLAFLSVKAVGLTCIEFCITDSNLNHTGIYLYSKGKIMIHLTFDYKTDEKCTTPGQYLKYHRTFQGLTTRELAEKVGIVPATLVLYENDRHPIKHDIAVALANTLGIDRNRLLDEYTAFVDYPYSSLLKKVRHELSLTQMQMAEVIGIGQTTYSGWEREARVPRRKEHDKILAALKKLKVNVDTYLCQSTSI